MGLLGRTVQERREELGIGQAELAKQVGVTQQTISRWENDRRKIDRATVALLRQLVGERRAKETPVGDFLRRLHHPRRLGRTVTVKLAS